MIKIEPQNPSEWLIQTQLNRIAIFVSMLLAGEGTPEYVDESNNEVQDRIVINNDKNNEIVVLPLMGAR